MSYALLFPGQASQYVGMGRDLAEQWPAANRVYDLAEQASGLPLRRLCFEGPEDELTRTANLQPAVVATSLAVLAAGYAEAGLSFEDGFPTPPSPPKAVAGHSVGEYTGLVAAGALSIPAAIALVAERGRLMEAASEENPGTMLALIGGDDDAAAALCAAVRDAVPGSYVQVANHNSPGQAVIAGDLPGIAAAGEAAREHGFRRALPIAVSGAFHSAAMQPAAARLRAALESVRISPPAIPVVANIDADMKTDPAALREELAEQVVSPVRWSDSIRALGEAGVETFLEVGPGKVLARLTGRILDGARSESIGDAEAIPLLAAHLSGTENQS
jgi:[acyl-carrier-protein] S-malonyltransferase